MDAFLPGLPGWEPMTIIRVPGISFQQRVSRKTGEGTRAKTCFEYFWNVLAADKAHSIPRRIGKRTPQPIRDRTHACRLGLFSFVAATGQRFRTTVANETDDAGAVDWRRQIAWQ